MKKNMFIGILTYIGLASSLFASFNLIGIVTNFTNYPLNKDLVSESRGGNLPDNLAMTDGLGTILIQGLSKESNLSNSSYNNLLIDNQSIMDDNNKTLAQLITDNIILIPTDTFTQINMNGFVTANTNVDGTACDDGDATTTNTTWLNNVCQGGVVIGSACDDSNASTSNDVYQSDGTCSGTPFVISLNPNGSVNCLEAPVGTTIKNPNTGVDLFVVGDLGTGANGIDTYIANNPTNPICTSHVTNMSALFYYPSPSITYPTNINNWDTSHVTNIYAMFMQNNSFNQDINNWDTSHVTNMKQVFYNSSFNQPLNNWNTSNVIYFNDMFNGATAFNQPLNNWDTSNVTSFRNMFNGATAFNQSLNSWNLNKAYDLTSMFNGATSFNQPLNDWNVSNVVYLNYIFSGATSFNSSVSGWKIKNASVLYGIFNNATSFNQPLNTWTFSDVRGTSYMFQNATSFNQDISGWNMSNVSVAHHMFNGATSFNQPLNNWNTRYIRDFNNMFHGATSFNQPLNNWKITTYQDVNMESMFNGATSFDKDISGWTVSHVNNHTDFDTSSPIAGTSNEPNFP